MTKTYNDIEAVTRLLEEVSLTRKQELAETRSVLSAVHIASLKFYESISKCPYLKILMKRSEQIDKT